MKLLCVALICEDEFLLDKLLHALKFYRTSERTALILAGSATDSIRALHINQLKSGEKPKKSGIYRTTSMAKLNPNFIIYTSPSDYFEPESDEHTENMLYLGSNYSFWIGAELDAPSKCKWLDLSDLHFACIDRKPACLEGSINPIRYKDLPDYLQRASRTEILLEPAREMMETLFFQDPTSYTIYHPHAEIPSINLRLESIHNEISLKYIYQKIQFAERQVLLDRHVKLVIKPDWQVLDKSSYNLFAKYYDGYMSHVDYDSWVDCLKIWHEKYSPLKLHKILEIACGTASIASRFVCEGYEVYASDNSPYMLYVADQKPFKPILFNADMLDPVPEKGLDLVICLFDSINYLLHTSDIYRCFLNVYDSLKRGGLFIFDISTLANSLDNFYDITSYTVNRDGNIIHEAFYNELNKTQCSKLSFFQKHGAVYSKHVEEHSQKVYRSYEIVNVINSSPLKLVGLHSLSTNTNLISRRNSDLDKTYHRLFYVLRRED